MIKVAPVKPTIKHKDFSRLDIRVGTILHVEDIVKSDNLVKLIVDFGDHRRIIIAGMKKERENPKEIEGIQTLFLINLEPRKMMGEISNGMILDIGYADKINPVLAVPEKPVPNGTRLG